MAGDSSAKCQKDEALMRRYFAKLVELRAHECYGMTFFIFDFTAKTVQQINTDGSGQEAGFTGFKYKEDRRELLFVVNGDIEETKIHEISEEFAANLMREENWQRLCYGLSIKSQKTIDWLVKAGIEG